MATSTAAAALLAEGLVRCRAKDDPGEVAKRHDVPVADR